MEKPTLYTTLRLLRGADVRNEAHTGLNEVVDSVVLAGETSKKLNFGVSYTIFKNLLPLNVNDVTLPLQKVFRSKKSYKSVDALPVPELCDFLGAMEPLTRFVPEPELCLEIDYFRCGVDVYKWSNVSI